MKESGKPSKMTPAQKRKAIADIEENGPWTIEQDRREWRRMQYHDDKGIRTAAEAIEGVAVRSGSEPIADETPLELAVDAERRREGMEKLRQRYNLETFEDLTDLLGDYAKLQREEGADEVLCWFFADGWHPGKVMMRVFGLAMVRNPVLVAGMSQSELAAMVGRGRAAISARMKLLFPDTLRRGAKSDESRRKMANKARANGNRKNGAKKNRAEDRENPQNEI